MNSFHWEGTVMFDNKRIAVLGTGKLGEAGQIEKVSNRTQCEHEMIVLQGV